MTTPSATQPVPFYVSWSAQATAHLLPVERAEHDEFMLVGGQRVYDFTSTSFQTAFGHSHPLIRQRIHEQLDAMPIASPKADFELKRSVSERLLKRLGYPNSGKVFYTVGGAEAVENALKIARHFTGRKLIASRKQSYHGATLGAMSVSGDWRSDPHVRFDEGTLRIPEPADDPNATATARVIEEAGPENVSAILIETISGTNGVYIPPRSWADGLQHLCREYKILLIADEIFCGFGRTGADFAFQHYELQPDLICLSKAISGGYIPLGAVWTSPTISHHYDNSVLACGLTSYAHPLGLAAASAVLDVLDQDAFNINRRELEQVFAVEVQRLSETHAASAVRQRGLLAAIEFGERTLPPWTHFIEHQLYVFTQRNRLILAPPLVSTPTRLQQAFAALHRALVV